MKLLQIALFVSLIALGSSRGRQRTNPEAPREGRAILQKPIEHKAIQKPSSRYPGQKQCPIQISDDSFCFTMPFFYGCFCLFKYPAVTVSWTDSRDNAIAFHAAPVSFKNVDYIAQFTKVVNFQPGFTIWTAGFYSTTSQKWQWDSYTVMNASVFCGGVFPDGVDANGNARAVYYDGSGCLSASDASIPRAQIMISDSYNF